MQAKQENDRVFFQHIPTDMPALVPSKRLTALQPFELPPAALDPLTLEAFTSAPPAPTPTQPEPSVPSVPERAVLPASA